MIKITLPDGSIREFEGVVTPLEVANLSLKVWLETLFLLW